MQKKMVKSRILSNLGPKSIVGNKSILSKLTLVTVFVTFLFQGSVLKNFFGINYIKIDVIQGTIQLVESIFDIMYAKLCFIGLTPGLIFFE